MFRWLRKNKPLLVHTIEIGVALFRNGKETDDKGKLFFYLFEDAEGNRSFTHLWQLAGISPNNKNNFERIEEYGQRVYPWLNGAYFKDIPSYWDIIKKHRADDIQKMYRRYFNK